MNADLKSYHNSLVLKRFLLRIVYIFFSFGTILLIYFSSVNLIDGNFKVNFFFTWWHILIIMVTTYVIVLLLNYVLQYIIIHQDHNIEIYPELNTNSVVAKELTTIHDVDSLISTIKDTSEKVGVKIDSIIISDTPSPNAVVIQMPFIPTTIIVNTNTFEILNQVEQEALFGHEMGHLYNWDLYKSNFFRLELLYKRLLILFAIISIYPMLFSVQLNFTFGRLIVLLITIISYWIIIQLFHILHRRLMYLIRKYDEVIADSFAAENISALATINMLITLGQRIEVINTLLEDFETLEMLSREEGEKLTVTDKARLTAMLGLLPKDSLDTHSSRLMAPELYILFKLYTLKVLYQVPIEDEEINDLALKGAENMIESGIWTVDNSEEITASTIKETWRDFDTNKNLYLEYEECKVFIESLKKQPDRFIFTNEVSIDHIVQTHPDFRSRIINVAPFMRPSPHDSE